MNRQAPWVTGLGGGDGGVGLPGQPSAGGAGHAAARRDPAAARWARSFKAAMQQGEAAMEQGEAAVEHDQRETMNPAPLITARLRVDAIPIQLANKVITR